MTQDNFSESRPMSTNIFNWNNEWRIWLTIISVKANRWYGRLVNSLGGKFESSLERLSFSWEENLLLALSHPDISLCSNPHYRSQANAQASREPNTHPDVLLYTPITREQWEFLTSRTPTGCVSPSELCIGESVTWQNSKRGHMGRDGSNTEKDSGNNRYTSPE